MKTLSKISCFLIIIACYNQSWSQQSIAEPFDVSTTYQQLITEYDFITTVPSVGPDRITYNENIIYKKTKQGNLDLDIYQPDEAFLLQPAVILIHGGKWASGDKENLRAMAQHLALSGFVGITLNYRLATVAPYPSAVLDLKDAIKWIRANSDKYNVNPDKIAILGAEAGGHLATLVGGTPDAIIYSTEAPLSDAVQAIVNIEGLLSFTQSETVSQSLNASKWLNGTLFQNPTNWKEASPLEYVGQKTPPILFINSSLSRYNASQNEMISLLKIFQIHTEVRTIPDAPEYFWLVNPWFQTTLDYTIKFLNKALKV